MGGRSFVQRGNFQGVDLFGGNDALFNEILDTYIVPWIYVEGYDTSIPEDEIKALLTNHFGSCGNLLDIWLMPPDRPICAYLRITGKGVIDNALKLNGTKIGGNKIFVVPRDLPINHPEQYIFCSSSSVPADSGSKKVEKMEGQKTVAEDGRLGFNFSPAIPAADALAKLNELLAEDESKVEKMTTE